MSEWREEREAPPRDWDDLKKKALIGAACACAVIAWMMFARPGEDAPSSRGFNMGAEGASQSTSRSFATRETKTGLDMVSASIGDGPEGVTPAHSGSSYAGSGGIAAQLPAGAFPGGRPEYAAPSAAPSPAPSPAANPDTAASREPDPDPALGIPTSKKGLEELGSKHGLLSKITEKVLGSPTAVKFLLNNKIIVDGLFAREVGRRNCESGSALKSYLSDSKNPNGVAEDMPILNSLLKHPESAAVAASSEFGRRVMECPSVKEILKDPSAIMSVAMSNPQALGLLTNPQTAQALATNPQAAGMLSEVQSSMGGSGGAPER